MKKCSSYLLIFAGFALCVLLTTNIHAENKSKKNSQEILVDKPLANYKVKLLDIAFETATKIPVKPHIKDRSRAQEEVIKAFIELGQPNRALASIDQIKNWRKGSAYGELAIYCAGKENKCLGQIPHYLDLAEQIAKAAGDWRKDHIRVKIAKAYTLLGQKEKSDIFEKDIVDSESGKVAAIRAMMADKDSYDEQMSFLDESISTGTYELIENALHVATKLYNRFYDDISKRTSIKEKIKSSWRQMPLFVRINLLMEMAEANIEHNNKPKAIELVNEAQLFIDNNTWPLEHKMKVATEVIKTRFKSGDEQKARKDADALFSAFKSGRNTIADIYRARALRMLAEAYIVTKNPTMALKVYKEVLEEGFSNPNSRPRAEDLSATCLSMATNGLEPNKEIWNRIEDIKNTLGSPW